MDGRGGGQGNAAAVAEHLNRTPVEEQAQGQPTGARGDPGAREWR
jgi:hypothetical protein